MQSDPEAVCEECRCLGAFRFDGATLCESCYATTCDSCCSDDDN